MFMNDFDNYNEKVIISQVAYMLVTPLS